MDSSTCEDRSETERCTSTSAQRSSGGFHLMSSGRKKIVLVCLALNALLINMCFSVIGPVFPIEVRKIHPHHDITAGFAIGAVFSVATLTDFLSAPFAGRELPRLGAKRMFGLGAFLVSGVTILFSFVPQIEPFNTFLGFCYALRISQGFGTAMVFVSSFALLAGTFPDSVASVSGMLEVFTGLGFMVGPAVGGVLYEHGGFKSPFLFVGCLLLAGTAFVQVVLPREDLPEDDHASFPSLTIIRQPRAALMLVTGFMTSTALAFFDPTLGPFLHEGHHLSPSVVGACFLISPGLYMVLAPVVGYIADNHFRRPLIPLGCFSAALGYELMGPNAVFGIEASLGVVLTGLAVVGVGVVLAFVPLSADILDTMHKKGYPDSPELHGAVGGLLGSTFSLGLTVGPAMGGTLTGSFNFGDASALLGLLYAVLGGVLSVQTMWSLIVEKCSRRDSGKDEGLPLTKMESKTSENARSEP